MVSSFSIIFGGWNVFKFGHMFRSSHFSFLVFGHFWQRSYDNKKILCNLCLHFARQEWKENHATKVTKIPKTQRRKYRMNKTFILIFMSFSMVSIKRWWITQKIKEKRHEIMFFFWNSDAIPERIWPNFAYKRSI